MLKPAIWPASRPASSVNYLRTSPSLVWKSTLPSSKSLSVFQFHQAARYETTITSSQTMSSLLYFGCSAIFVLCCYVRVRNHSELLALQPKTDRRKWTAHISMSCLLLCRWSKQAERLLANTVTSTSHSYTLRRLSERNFLPCCKQSCCYGDWNPVTTSWGTKENLTRRHVAICTHSVAPCVEPLH